MNSDQITLTWGQFVWGMGVIFFLGGMWMDLRSMKKRLNEMVYTKAEVDLMIEASKVDRGHLWEAIRELRGEHAS